MTTFTSDFAAMAIKPLKMRKFLYLFSICVLVLSCKKDSETLTCDISELEVALGSCTSDSTYTLTIDFQYDNAINSQFDLYVRNNVLIGTYGLPDLPLSLTDFPMSGLIHDYIRVCIHEQEACCDVLEFLPPSCEPGDCDITELNVTIGECIDAEHYELTIDFEYENAGNEHFDLYVRNGVHIGTYNLNQLPLTLPEFALSGLTHDFIKVCINDQVDCCAEIEFLAPDCTGSAECHVHDITVSIGECIDDFHYALTIDFQYENPGNTFFDLYVRNGVFIGYYSLEDLPITVPDFPLSGLTHDFVKVCINDNADCCTQLEFLGPICP